MIAAAFALALTTTPAPPIVGGYQTVSVKRSDVREVAQFAVRSAPRPVKLSWLISAETQVVAGTNYRLCMGVKPLGVGYFAKGNLVSAVVYRDLGNHLTLTSWQPAITCKS